MSSLQVHKFIILALITLLLIFLAFGFNNGLIITNYTYSNAAIPFEFNNYRIAQISDLHCKRFGKDNNKLIAAIANLNPDIIVITGDMIDNDHKDLTPVENLLQGISSIAPIYSISGNHEFDEAALYSQLIELYSTYGVTNLDNSKARIVKSDSSYTLYGLGADRMDVMYNHGRIPEVDASSFNIALYHFSNHFDYFSKSGFDLILSGHTHGGILRLPGIGGLIDNDGSFFPNYDGGLFTRGASTMISSRGLGDTVLPRFFNRPELLCITLKSIQ